MKRETIKTLEIWTQVYRRAWIWVAACAAFDVAMAFFSHVVPREESFLFVTVLLAIFGVTLIFNTVGVIVVNQVAYDFEQKTSQPLFGSIGKNFNQSMIESLRALSPIVLKSLLLIVPGIVEAIKLYWLVYIVQFDKDYQSGNVDALVRSRELVSGRFFKTVVLLLFVLGLGMFPGLIEKEDMFSHPLRLAFYVALTVAFEILGDVILYRFYMRVQNGIAIQKSGNSVT